MSPDVGGQADSSCVSRGGLVLVALVLAAVVELLDGRSVAAVPLWSTKVPQDREALYVWGVATASTVDDAQRNALLNAALQVAEQFAFTVEGRGTRLRTELENRLVEELKFSSGRVPLNQGFVREWRIDEVPGGYRVFALVRYPYAELERTKRRFETERIELLTRARGAIRAGEAAWRAGRLNDAAQAFVRAMASGRDAGDRSVEAEARGRLRQAVMSLELTAVSGDGQIVKPGGGLAPPLVVRVTSQWEGEIVPMKGVPVRFAREDRSAVPSVSAVTNDGGEAHVTIPPLSELGLIPIRAQIDLETIVSGTGNDPDADEEVRQSTMDRTLVIPGVLFTIKVVPVQRAARILILVEETNLGRASAESIVGQTLSEHLQRAGYRVIADHEIGRTNVERLRAALHEDRFWPLDPILARQADAVLTGRADTNTGSDNLGWAHSAHAAASVRVIDVKRGEVVAEKSVSAVVGFGESVEQAGLRALETAAREVAESVVGNLVLREETVVDGKP